VTWDNINLWLLRIFDVLGLIIMLLLGFIGALRPLIAALRGLRRDWSGPQTPGQE
jgi:hypothetical protein